MAEMYDITCSPSSGPSDDISLLLNHLLASSSSSSSSSSSYSLTSVSNKQREMPFSHLLPLSSSSQTSDGTFALAAGNSTGIFPNSGWKILSYVNTPPDDHRRRCHVGNSTAESTGLLDSSAAALIVPSPGGYNPVAVEKKEADGTLKICSSISVDCHAAAVKRRNVKVPVDSDFDDFDCESEEGFEASEEPSKPIPARAGLKRSRAAEVHNLSEKRRRSRINEKMKALQNLIPNSNKTDKASMLDEAIEYLKQLQLQVQMLSMRNGLSLHPLYRPGPLQPFQLPQMRMGFGAGNSLLHMNTETGMLAMNQDSSNQTTFSLSNQQPSSHHPIVMPGATNITNAEASFGLDSSQASHGPFQLSTVPEELYREGILSEQKLDISRSAKNPSGGSS